MKTNHFPDFVLKTQESVDKILFLPKKNGLLSIDSKTSNFLFRCYSTKKSLYL